jgi:hypothetical protein
MKVIQPTQSLFITYEVEANTPEGRVVRSETQAIPRLGEVIGWSVGEFKTPGNPTELVRGVKISFDRSRLQDRQTESSRLAPLRFDELVPVPPSADNIQLRFPEIQEHP